MDAKVPSGHIFGVNVMTGPKTSNGKYFNKIAMFVNPQTYTFSEMAVRESLMAFGEHSRLSECRVFGVFFIFLSLSVSLM